MARVEIADDGPGIAPGDRDKLFTPYYSTKRRGSGLGLAIVKHVLVRMQGDLTVNSVLGSGSTFTCYLPGSLVHRRAA